MESRKKLLNTPVVSDGKCILYVMSRDQRVQDNHALLAAQEDAINKKLPLAVVFCLLPRSGYRAQEHYRWMLQGLHQVEQDLAKLHIPFMMLIGDPLERLQGMIHHTKPQAIYFDMNPLHGPRKFHEKIAQHVKFPVYEVDTHNIVPVWQTSDKQEYAARTIRPKIHTLLPAYLAEPARAVVHPHPWPGVVRTLSELDSIIEEHIRVLPSNRQLVSWRSGETAAHSVLQDFINNRLTSYATKRNDPTIDGLSGLSPFLHFGQVSSLRVALEIEQAVSEDLVLRTDADALIEEIVVRKELSDNFCFYNADYNQLTSAPDWALRSLQKHANDPREFTYTKKLLEHAQTHDLAWNAAQMQLVKTGKMHGYMRMYWAKKVLEWTESPQAAHKILVELNDFYSIDGGDPNGYVGILWAIAGLHDRPWAERAVFGTVRNMNYAGLKRKFDVQKYIDMWN